MKCEACGAEVRVKSSDEGTSSYELVNKKMSAQRKELRIPFACGLCGAIDFKFQAVRDVVFLYPTPKVERVGMIWLLDQDVRGGSAQEALTPPTGYILSAGNGDVNRKTNEFMDFGNQIVPGDMVYFNRNVPWELELPGPDGAMHKVVYCGFMDLFAKVCDE